MARYSGMMACEHHYPLVIQYEDTDAGDITYHASYINFAERARSAWLTGRIFAVRLAVRAKSGLYYSQAGSRI